MLKANGRKRFRTPSTPECRNGQGGEEGGGVKKSRFTSRQVNGRVLIKSSEKCWGATRVRQPVN